MANDTAFRAGRFLQGQVTQDFAGCGPGTRPGFAGAAGPGAAVTGTIECNPSAIDACPTLKGCQTVPPTGLCTPVPEFCPTFCGPDCQTPQPNCTSINCTQAGPQCPPQTLPPQCPAGTNPILDCTFGCTLSGPDCPVTPFPQCGNVTLDPSCQTVNVQPQAVGAAAPGGGANITLLTMPVWACGPTPATRCFICPPMTFDYNCNVQQRAAQVTPATVCTQSGPQCPSVIDACPTRPCTQLDQCQSAVDACPTRLCGGGGAVGAAAPGTWPTPQTRCFVCDPKAAAAPAGGDAQITLLTMPVWACGPTPATRCFICPPMTFDYNCYPQQQAVGGGGGAAAAPGTWPTPATRCRVCHPVDAGGAVPAPNTAATVCTQYGPGCHTYPNGDCTFFGCGPGGGGGQTAATVCTQFGHQCQSAVDACPTRLCAGGGGGAVGAAAVPGAWPTPQTRCFVCDPVAARAGGGGGLTAATVCTQAGHQCRSAVDACPTRLCNQQAVGTWPTPQTRCFVC